jgi:hypothetical protein
MAPWSGFVVRLKGSVVIELVNDIDYVYMILIAAGVGVIGGLGAELLIQRADNTGTVELPGRLKDTRFFDIGFPASLIVGAIAAVAVLYFFPPVVEKITAGANGAPPTTTNEYDLVKLVALSLIVGSAGPAFLATAQSRLMSALNAQKADTAVETGKTQVDQVAGAATGAVSGAVQEAVSKHIPSADADTVKAVAEAATASLEGTLEPQVKVARDQINAISPTS